MTDKSEPSHREGRGGPPHRGTGGHFKVWAPLKDKMGLHIVHPFDRKYDMKKEEEYFILTVEEAGPGTQYFFMVDDKDVPDVGSQYQPEGVHGPSEIIDHQAYQWKDAGWRGIPLRKMILYELHVGTFTEAGTFEAIIPRLDDLVDTGINALELMPVCQFPGTRNWGYDGVFPYAVQNSYGGPQGLKRLVDACHQRGIAVFLDLVYNHVGPEGAYFSAYGPYFNGKYRTPWGDAINYDDHYSDGVRDFFSDNALFFFEQYHIDGLRLDAIHFVFDMGAVSFWELLDNKRKMLEEKLGRYLYITAESDLNSTKITKPPAYGGFGFDAQWLDDFHHALYTLLDKKGRERYGDFGGIEQLVKAYTDGFVHAGEYVDFRKRKYGATSAGTPADQFIAFNLNHDQVGNRVKGERLSLLIDYENLKLAAAALLLSPYIPLLFMGEEYAEETPFFYFTCHSDPDLIEGIKVGRKKEFAAFGFTEDPCDAQDETTYNNSKLQWERRKEGRFGIMRQWYKKLIDLRNTEPALQNVAKDGVKANIITRQSFSLIRLDVSAKHRLHCLFNFGDEEVSYPFFSGQHRWAKIVDSKEKRWMPGESAISHVESGVDTIEKDRVITLLPGSVLVYKARPAGGLRSDRGYNSNSYECGSEAL